MCVDDDTWTVCVRDDDVWTETSGLCECMMMMCEYDDTCGRDVAVTAVTPEDGLAGVAWRGNGCECSGPSGHDATRTVGIPAYRRYTGAAR